MKQEIKSKLSYTAAMGGLINVRGNDNNSLILSVSHYDTGPDDDILFLTESDAKALILMLQKTLDLNK